MSPLGNIAGEVTMQQLLANDQLVPGLRGADLKVGQGEVIRLVDLSQQTVNHNGSPTTSLAATSSRTTGCRPSSASASAASS